MTTGMCVLHVDDEPGYLDLASSALEDVDDRLTVVTATSAAEGLDRLADRDVDCVVSDYEMSERNGIEFLEAVRETHPDLPFILHTGKGSEEIASEAISAGVTDYLQKGNELSQFTVLANRIENAVGQTRAAREREQMRERMELALEHTDSTIFEIDLATDGMILHGAFEEFLDRPAARIESWTDYCEEVVHPDDQAAFREFVRELMAGDRDGGTLAYRIDPEQGRVRWMEAAVSMEATRWSEGTQAVGIARDITAYKDRERELRQKEHRYQAIFNDPNILVGLIDTDGTVLDINEEAMGYVDASLDQVVGTLYWETAWFDHSTAVQDSVRDWIDRAANGEYVEFEADLERPDGEPYTLEGVFRPVTNDDGEVVSLLVSDRDVTDQRARERELEGTNALLSTLVDTLPHGILVEDASRRVQAANRQLVELFDLKVSAAALEGEDCEQLLEEVSAQFVEPASFVDRIETLVADREAVDDEELVLADGRTFVRSHRPVDLTDGDGHLWMYEDVTGRKARERELERARDLLEQAERVASVGGWEIDTETMDVYWTEHLFELLGVDYDEEPPLEEALDVYHEADRPTVETAVEDALASGEPFDVEVQFVRPDGEIRWLRVQGSPTMNAGEVVSLRGAVQDVTEQKHYERALERQNDRLEEFTSVVSHDLRSPLSVADGRLELARNDVDSPHLEEVAAAHDRMKGLIDDLLSFAREGETPLDIQAVELPALAADCWRTVETADATLVTEIDGAIRADESRLCQLFENLFRNAVEHGGEDVTVTVGALDDGFYVEDDGAGITVADEMDPFEAGFSTNPDGTGFGLSIVKQVAETHDWDIRVSESASGGARFEVTAVTRAMD